MSQWQNRIVKPKLILTGPDALSLEDTVFDDQRFAFTRDRQGVAAKPDYDFTNMGLLFPQNDATEIVYISVQMKHRMLLGSDIRPHVHFTQDVADQPVWKLDYRWYENGGNPNGGFTTITAIVFKYTYVATPILQIAEFPHIDGSGIASVSSTIDFRVYRDDNVVAGDVLGKEFDFHFEIDSMGSRDEYSK